MKLKNSIYWYFWITSFLILLYGLALLVWDNDGRLLLHVNDVNIIVDRFQLTMLFKIAYLVLGILYWFAFRMKLRLNAMLTKVHTVITIGGVAANALVMLAELIRENVSGNLHDGFARQVTFYIVVLVLAAQSLFVINFGMGMLKSSKNRN